MVAALLLAYLAGKSPSQQKRTLEKKLDPKQGLGAPRCLLRPLCCCWAGGGEEAGPSLIPPPPDPVVDQAREKQYTRPIWLRFSLRAAIAAAKTLSATG